MSKWEIMQRVADTRKEIETFAQDWADVPGGTRLPWPTGKDCGGNWMSCSRPYGAVPWHRRKRLHKLRQCRII